MNCLVAALGEEPSPSLVPLVRTLQQLQPVLPGFFFRKSSVGSMSGRPLFDPVNACRWFCAQFIDAQSKCAARLSVPVRDVNIPVRTKHVASHTGRNQTSSVIIMSSAWRALVLDFDPLRACHVRSRWNSKFPAIYCPSILLRINGAERRKGTPSAA